MSKRDRPDGFRVDNTDRSKRGFAKAGGNQKGGHHEKGCALVLLASSLAIVTAVGYLAHLLV